MKFLKALFPSVALASFAYLSILFVISRTESENISDLSYWFYLLFFLVVSIIFVFIREKPKDSITPFRVSILSLLSFILSSTSISLFSLLGVGIFLSSLWLLTSLWFRIKVIHFLSYLGLSYFLFQLFLFQINFAIDEGFLILLIFIYGLLSSTVFLMLQIVTRIQNVEIKKVPQTPMRTVGLLFCIFIVNILSFSLGYWNSLDLLEREITPESISEKVAFNIISDLAKEESGISEVEAIDLIDQYLQIGLDAEEPRLDVFALRYIFFEEEEYLEKFKEELLRKVKDDVYLGPEGSIKAWQFSVSSDAYYYNKLKNLREDYFSDSEQGKIEDWFYDVNVRAYNNSLADYSYGFLFKKIPKGLYLNQDIGYGMISILNEVLEERDASIVAKNNNVLSEEKPGWDHNYKNADDGISYHQDVWIQNSYLIYEYGKVGTLDNAKLSCDWIVYQTPYASGRHPNYNSYNENSAVLSMIIGNHYLDSLEYRYLIMNMLESDITNNVISENLVGFDLLPESFTVQKPSSGSVVINSPTGLNSHVSEIKPDKFVLRELLPDGRELLIIFNLRSSGWHKYHSSGELITIMVDGEELYGQQIKKDLKHDWLPRGKASHRDLKIQNDELLLPLRSSVGLERLMYYAMPIDRNLLYKDNYQYLEGELEEDSGVWTLSMEKDSFIKVSLSDNVVTVEYNYPRSVSKLEFEVD